MRLSLSRRFRLAGVAIAAGALTLTLVGPAVAQAAPATVVPDANFAACLNGILGVADPAAPITQVQLAGLDSVGCVGPGITSIDGAQYLTSMKSLELSGNQVSDLRPLSGLTNLMILGLNANQISDISPLSGLSGLTTLYLDENQVSDLTPLSRLNLTHLSASENQISDIGPLSGLTYLAILTLDSNQISAITALSGLSRLRALQLDGNRISNLTPLSGLDLLALEIADNQVSDISPLSGLINLGYLDISNNHVSDLSALQNAPSLQSLTPAFEAGLFAGGQSLAARTVTAGDTVSLPSVTAMPGYSPVIWSVLSGSATISGTTFRPASPGVAVLGWSDKGGIFTGTVNVNVLAAASTNCGFADVPSSNQYGSYICWMKATGVTTGTSPTTFAPAANVTRGQMAAFMYRLAGSPAFNPPSKPTFTDVPASNEFFKQIEWLKHTGITTGTTATTFAPAANVTRGQMAAFMYRLAASPAFNPPSKPTFTDVPASNEFFKQIEWLKHTGITTGTTATTFAPSANVTREQMAAFMYRLAQGRYYCTSYAGGANC